MAEHRLAILHILHCPNRADVFSWDDRAVCS